MADRSTFEMLYRSPTLLIDKHEWHCVVWRRGGSVTVDYRFRQPRREGCRFARWQRMKDWQGPLPKGFRAFFAPFKRSVEMARNSFGPYQRQAWADKRIAA